MRSLRRLAPLLVALILGLAALAARRPSHGGSARLPTDSPVHSLDPLDARWPAETLLVSALYDPPYQLELDGQPRPHLLLPVQGEGRSLRFKVRPHVLFHDGTRVRARQVFESLRRLARSRDSGWLLATVEGTAPGRSAPSGLKLLGRETIEIRLASSRGLELLALGLSAPQAGVVPSPHKAARGVGSGPFALRGRRGGEHLLRAHRDYFDGPPYLNEVRLLEPASRDDHIRRFQLGRADGSLLGDSVYGEPPIKGVALAEGPPADTVYLVFNTDRGAARQEPMRRAVHLALDRRRLAAGAAEPAGFPGGRGYQRADPGRARALVSRLGSTSGGRPLILLVEESDALGMSLGPLVERDLSTVGLAVELVKASPAEARARRTSGTWDLRLQTLSPASPHPVLQLGQVLALGGLHDEAFRLVRESAVSPREEVARALAALESRLPLVPLCQRRPRLHHRASLRGVTFDRLGALRLADIWRLSAEEGR